MRRHNLLTGLSIWMLSTACAQLAPAADARLADAVMSGDKDAIRALPADRANINTPQPDGTTALHWAVRHNDLATADALIKAGADVKAATRYGVTPMALAATNADPAMIRRLLDAGADPNSAAPSGETALMTAARTGKVDAVTVLLDRGANVNAKDTVHAQTALMWAVLENHPDMVKLLLARGADINAHTNVTIPKGEYTPARAGGASGVGIIRHAEIGVVKNINEDGADKCPNHLSADVGGDLVPGERARCGGRDGDGWVQMCSAECLRA